MYPRIQTKRFQSILVVFIMAGLFCVASLASAQQSAGTYKTSYRYNSLGQQTGVILADPDGSGSLTHPATRNTYDDRGYLILVEEGRLASYQTNTIAPKNWSGFTVHRKVVYTYDNLGRRLTEAVATASGNKQTLAQFSYDGYDRVTCKAVRMNPNAYNSLPASACTLGTEGAFGPDRITRFTYGPEGHGEVTKEERAVGTPLQQDYTRFSYDSYYRVKGITDANGNHTHQTYDSSGRLYRRYFPSKTATGSYNSSDYEQYSYDNNGNRTALRKRDGRWIYFNYDNLNRVTKKNVPGSSEDVYYGYDLRGLQLFARFASSTGQGVTNTYDGFGNLATSSTNLGGATRTLSYSYDRNNNRSRLMHPDGKYFPYTYDGLDRVKNIYEYYYTAIASYVYDNQGRLSHLNRLAGAGTVLSYDTIARPDHLSHNLYGTVDDVDYNFDHNPASQIVSRTTSNDEYVYAAHALGTENYSVNGLNQYTSVDGANHSYDANGNLTSDGSTTYTYDIENRLKSASGAKNAVLKYDPLGRLYETSGGGATTRFLYDGDALVAEYNTSGAILSRYVHGPGADSPLLEYEGASVSSGTRRFLYADHRGSITARTTSNGSVVNINQYDSYGIPDSLNSGRFAFTGQILLPELGFYHYKARIYSPFLGRFLQTDPIGYDDHVNLYLYVGNDPLNYLDYSGLERHHVGFEAKIAWLKGIKLSFDISIDTESYEMSAMVATGPRVGIAAGLDGGYYEEQSHTLGNALMSHIKGEAVAEAPLVGHISTEVGWEGNTTEGVSYLYPDEPTIIVGPEDKGDYYFSATAGADVGLDVGVGINVSGPDTLNALGDAAAAASEMMSETLRNCPSYPYACY